MAEGKSQPVAKKDYNPEEKTAIFLFSDGTEIVWNVGAFPTKIQTDLMLHGAIQKGGDSYAGVKGDVKLAIENVRKLGAALLAGDWGPEREGGGVRIGAIAEAIARIKGVTVDEARTALTASEDASDAEKEALSKKIATLRAHPQIKLVISQIALEKAQKEAAEAPELVL